MRAAVLILLVPLVGCTSFKQEVGEYVTEAVTAHVTERVEAMLERRGLDIAAIHSATDVDQDGTITAADVKAAVREVATEVVAARLDRATEDQRSQYDEATETLLAALKGTPTPENPDPEAPGILRSLWGWVKAGAILLGLLLLSSLATWLWGGRQHKQTSARLATVEKLLQRDLDGDGRIGGAPSTSEDPPPTA